MTAPCHNCPDRHELCHADCERYKEYRAKRDEMNRKRQEERLLRYGRPPEKDRAQWREMYRKKTHKNW